MVQHAALEGAERLEGLALRIADRVEPFGHPLRLRIVAWAYGRDCKLTARAFADAFGLERPVVGYHVRKLVDCGIVEPDGTQRRRGGIERAFCLSARGVELLIALGEVVIHG